jgi:hypothetical protein
MTHQLAPAQVPAVASQPSMLEIASMDGNSNSGSRNSRNHTPNEMRLPIFVLKNSTMIFLKPEMKLFFKEHNITCNTFITLIDIVKEEKTINVYSLSDFKDFIDYHVFNLGRMRYDVIECFDWQFKFIKELPPDYQPHSFIIHCPPEINAKHLLLSPFTNFYILVGKIGKLTIHSNEKLKVYNADTTALSVPIVSIIEDGNENRNERILPSEEVQQWYKFTYNSETEVLPDIYMGASGAKYLASPKIARLSSYDVDASRDSFNPTYVVANGEQAPYNKRIEYLSLNIGKQGHISLANGNVGVYIVHGQFIEDEQREYCISFNENPTPEEAKNIKSVYVVFADMPTDVVQRNFSRGNNFNIRVIGNDALSLNANSNASNNVNSENQRGSPGSISAAHSSHQTPQPSTFTASANSTPALVSGAITPNTYSSIRFPPPTLDTAGMGMAPPADNGSGNKSAGSFNVMPTFTPPNNNISIAASGSMRSRSTRILPTYYDYLNGLSYSEKVVSTIEGSSQVGISYIDNFIAILMLKHSMNRFSLMFNRFLAFAKQNQDSYEITHPLTLAMKKCIEERRLYESKVEANKRRMAIEREELIQKAGAPSIPYIPEKVAKNMALVEMKNLEEDMKTGVDSSSHFKLNKNERKLYLLQEGKKHRISKEKYIIIVGSSSECHIDNCDVVVVNCENSCKIYLCGYIHSLIVLSDCVVHINNTGINPFEDDNYLYIDNNNNAIYDILPTYPYPMEIDAGLVRRRNGEEAIIAPLSEEASSYIKEMAIVKYFYHSYDLPPNRYKTSMIYKTVKI